MIDYVVAAAAILLQSCLILCDPLDNSSLGSSIPGVLQARILEWVAISFSNACMLSHFSCVRLCAILWTAAPRPLCPQDSLGKNTGVGCHLEAWNFQSCRHNL